jgi:SMC interacting uncharacterized protein involved in chromosome segregation
VVVDDLNKQLASEKSDKQNLEDMISDLRKLKKDLETQVRSYRSKEDDSTNFISRNKDEKYHMESELKRLREQLEQKESELEYCQGLTKCEGQPTYRYEECAQRGHQET